MTVTLIAAIAHGGVIGRDGGVPWHLPADMARFKELTTGHAVVMGRKTWDRSQTASARCRTAATSS